MEHYLKQELNEVVTKDNRIFEFLEYSALDGLWYWDLDKPENEWMDERFWKLFGYDPSEKKHLASEWQDMIFPEDLEKAIDNFNKHLEDPNYPYDQLVRYKHKDGSTVWVRCRGMAVRDENGKPIRMLGSHNDVTEVMKSKEMLETVLDSSLDGVQYFKSVRDDDGKIIDFEYVFSNKVACEIVNMSEDQLIGNRFLKLLPGHLDILPEYGKSLFEIYSNVVETNESISLLFKFDADGIEGWFSNKTVKLGDGFVVTFSIVTELMNQRKELNIKDKLLMQQSKLASMGEMIGAIAHQWRQPLNALSGIIINIQDLFKLGELDQKYLSEQVKIANNNIKYMSQTIDDFRSFSNPSKEVQIFKIKDVVDKVVNIISPQLENRDITLNSRVDSAMEVEGRFQELQQVIINLIHNSRDAVLQKEYQNNEKATIEISTQYNQNEIFIIIKDNGSGIKQKDEDKIFDPYFTTKSEENGSGIGLFLSQKIIQESFNGYIEYLGHVDGFTTFLIHLKK